VKGNRIFMDQKLKELMAELFRIKEEHITDTLAMKETEVWDSLKHMELIVSIEQTFETELTFDEIVAMQTFKDIKRILQEKGVTE
jgi:acyl carrier protein